MQLKLTDQVNYCDFSPKVKEKCLYGYISLHIHKLKKRQIKNQIIY